MYEIPVVFTAKQKAYNVHRAELYSWEITGFDDSFVAKDRINHQQGEDVKKYFCLAWNENSGQESDKGNGGRLPDNFHETVLELCSDVLDNKRFHKLEDFWNKWGPLVSLEEMNFKGRTLPILTIQNILLFFRQITVLWDACLHEKALPILDLFKNYVWLHDLENLFSAFNRVDSLYLYFERERPHISGNRGYIFGTEFYLELKDVSIQDGRPAITTDSAEIVKYMRKTLIQNINRLTESWSSGINFERDRFKATVTPNSLFSAALFSYIFNSSKQIKYCLGACGNFARPGSRYCSDGCQRKTHNESKRGTVADIKDKALSRYRTWKSRGYISAEDYEKLKRHVHSIDADDFSSVGDLKKMVEAYRIKEGIYP